MGINDNQLVFEECHKFPDTTSRGIGDYYEKVIVQESFFIQENSIHYPDIHSTVTLTLTAGCRMVGYR